MPVRSDQVLLLSFFPSQPSSALSLLSPKDYFDEISGEKMFGVKVESYPYLFDSKFKVKDAFFAALGDVSIKGY